MGLFLANCKHLLSVISPIFIGFCMAFVLTIPVNFFEKQIRSIPIKYRRTVSVILTYVLAIGLISVMLVYIVPSVLESVINLVSDFQSYGNDLGNTLNGMYKAFNIESDIARQVGEFIKNAFMDLTKITVDTMSHVVGFTFVVTGALFKWIIAFFFSIYMIASKEQLNKSVIRFARATMSEQLADYASRVASKSYYIFKNFIASQFLVAFLTGLFCFIGMKIFRFPFAELISTIIGFTALIPYFGGFIGPVPSIVIIMFVDINAAFGFTVFIVVMNLLIGNVLVPKVVGDAIGFDGFWVMVAITIGGGLFGFQGMLFGVPVLAIIHSLVVESVEKKLLEKYPDGTYD